MPKSTVKDVVECKAGVIEVVLANLRMKVSTLFYSVCNCLHHSITRFLQKAEQIVFISTCPFRFGCTSFEKCFKCCAIPNIHVQSLALNALT